MTRQPEADLLVVDTDVLIDYLRDLPQAVAVAAAGGDQGGGLALTDQITVAAAAVGAQAAQQFHRLQQVGFALAVAADHQQPRRLQLQLKRAVIAKLAQLQAMQPNGSGAV